MKLRTLTTAIVLAAITSAPASAMISKQDLNKALLESTFSGNVSGVINGDTVTLFGHVEGAYEFNKAKQAALNIEGVNKVIPRLTTRR